jgi:hypothetical protein
VDDDVAVIHLAALALVPMLAAGAPPKLTCRGPYIPPTDFDNEHGTPVTLEFAVATGPVVTGRQAVEDAARAQLIQRLCRLADPSSCAPLAASAKTWEVVTEGDKICAMVVVSAKDLELWRTQIAPDLDATLKAALQDLVPPKEPPKPSLLAALKKPKPTAIVILGAIDDRGAPGGLRAEWLLSRVRVALTGLGVEMIDAPRNWNGALPKDVTFLLRGSLVERVDPQKQLPVLDVTFTSQDGRRATRAARPVVIPAALAPMPPKPVTSPPPTVGVSLHVETRPGGNLCPGDYTQLYVTNETIEPLYVRVFDLDTEGEVLLLFPNEGHPDDLIMPGRAVPLSPDGFTIDGGEPGARERYVVLGARDPDGLGAFKDARGTCRYKPADAKKLWSGQRLEAAYRAVDGFTILDDVRCKKPIALPDKKLQAQALDQLPLCPPPG